MVYVYETEFGPFTLEDDGGRLTALYFNGMLPPGEDVQETQLLRRAGKQLQEYCAGKRLLFEVPLAPRGTEFMHLVWEQLLHIPYGQTRSYGEIAEQIGRPTASRAVGMANNKNPIPIFIPCHRVLGTNGKLTGYAGGLELKDELLRMEQRIKGYNS